MRPVMSIIIGAALLALGGCSWSSAPRHTNLSGVWDYDYIPAKSGKTKTGSMTLTQSQYALNGQANDAEGQFILTGTLNQTQLTLNGVDQAKGKSFTIKAEISSESAFAGTYQTNLGATGEISGLRQE